MSWAKLLKPLGKALAKAMTGNAAAKGAARPRNIPRLTMEMIHTDGKPITSAQAVKLFKDFSLQTGFLSKEELSEQSDDLAYEIKIHGENLLEDTKGEVPDIKNRIKDLKEYLKNETDLQELANLNEELKREELDLEHELARIQLAKQELAAFKADKRQFLIDYTNQLTGAIDK